MLDIGWTEMLVIAIVMIVVVGPKDLPKMLRTFGRTTAKLRAMAGDFQRQFNEALREAELDDVKKSVDELRSFNPANTIRKHLSPFEQAGKDLKSGLETLKSPTAAPVATAAPAEQQPASPDVHPAEPLKNGATAMPAVAGPETMPQPPVVPAPVKAAEPAMVQDKPVQAAATNAPAKAARPRTKPAPAKANSASAAGRKTARSDKTVPASQKPAAPARSRRSAKAAPSEPATDVIEPDTKASAS